MTPERQRIAIAEVCGHICTDHTTLSPDRWRVWYADVSQLIPDYLADLNQMHEAEAALTDDEAIQMSRRLIEAVMRTPKRYPVMGRLWHATAMQRAEAFLRALNLWDDTQ